MARIVEDLKDQLSRLQSQRSNFNALWERIARVVLPTSIGFVSSNAQGVTLNDAIFDSTAQLALPKFAAALDTLVTPQTSRWHSLVPADKALKDNAENVKFLASLTDRLFRVRYSPRANFASRNFEVLMGLGAFGNGVLFVKDAMPGIRYLSIHLSEFWFEENADGVIDTAFWVHEYKLKHLKLRWPGKLPKDIEDEPNQEKEFKVCMAVRPRVNRDPRQKDNRNMPFECVYFVADRTDAMLEESGFRKFPFGIARGTTAPRENYARSPASEALADIQTLQAMARTSLRYGELVTDPPWMTVDTDGMDPFAVRPGAMNSGYLGPDGQELAKPMRPSGDPGFSLELMNQRRQAVNSAFLVNLFQVLVDSGSDRMTATEVMQRVQEKGALLGPIAGRLRTEYLGPIIEREIDIIFHAGVIKPEDVPEDFFKDNRIDVEYDSPMTRAMRAEEGIGILRTFEFASTLAQAKPEVMKKLNADRALERMAEINGAPPDVLFSADEMAEKEQAEAESQAVQGLVSAAPDLANTAKTLAETQKIAGGQSAVV